MTINGWLQILFFLLLIFAVTKPMGIFLTRVFNRERTFLDPILRPVERLIYRLTGVNEEREMRWTEYAVAMLLFSVVSLIVLYLIQRLQAYLPFNPQKLANIEPSSSFNTAASFTSNTNWQSYVPETTMSYLTQMTGLAYHNFASAAVGISLAIAFIRGIARREKDTLGNFWVDFTRACLWVLLPFCLIGALVLVSQGTIQNLRPYDTIKLVDPQTIQVDKKDASGNVVNGSDGKPVQETQTVTEQVIAQGPLASQEFIKQWGTNGGGFDLQITLWLWFTVLFANFAEAMAEGRGKAQADNLRKARTETTANKLMPNGQVQIVPAPQLRKDDIVVVSAGEFIPGDGEIVAGVASVDESAITGESAPVIREAGGDRSAVTGGTRVLSDQIKIRITSNPGETFLDRMIALVEGASRQKRRTRLR